MDTEVIGGNTYLRLTITKNPAATDVTYSVEASGDLATPGSWNTSEVVIETNTATTLSARDSVSRSGTTKRFMRLRTSVP